MQTHLSTNPGNRTPITRRSALKLGGFAALAAGLLATTGIPPVDAELEGGGHAALQLGRAVALLESPVERIGLMTLAMREATRLMDPAEPQTA